MKLEQRFDVQAPIDAVWRVLNDLEQVTPCLPGAAITGHEDGTFHGEFTLRLGPFTTVHRGTIRIEAADEATRTARLAVRGSERSGSGATIVNSLTTVDGATRVDSVAELTIIGPLAAFAGSAVVEDISNRLLRDFATCLASRLTADDGGVCGGDVPPLVGDVLTGTGLTLAQAAARLARGEDVPALTPVQRRIVEDYASRL